MLASIEVWALPLNSALLIGLALVNAYIARKQREEKKDLVDLKRSLGVNRRFTDEGHDENGEHPQDTGERRRVRDRRGE